MVDGGFIADIQHMEDALPQLLDAVAEIRLVNSTVNGALSGLEGIVGSGGAYSSEAFEQMVQGTADALQRALDDLYPILVPPGEIPVGPGGWHGPGDHPGHGPGDDPETPWPGDDPDPGHSPDHSGPHDSHDDDDDEHGGGHDHDDHDHHSHDDDHEHGSSSSGTGGDPSSNQGQDQAPGQQDGSQQGGSSGSSQAGGAAGAAGVAGAAVASGKKNEDDEEEDEEVPEEETEDDSGFHEPDYVSAANRPLLDELEQKQKLLDDTQSRVEELEKSRAEKAEVLERLQAAVAAQDDATLDQRIELLKKEITDIDVELYSSKEMLPDLQDEIDSLQQRLELVTPGPGADLDAIRAMEGGETSQWIKDHTYDCVHYICERMPIPPELPFNAHLWDEQVAKYGEKYGMKIGDVPLEGSVIIMEREHSYASDIYGHVMYVEKVDADGIVWVTDNTYPDKLVRLDHLTTELTGPYIHYLYFPWETKV